MIFAHNPLIVLNSSRSASSSPKYPAYPYICVDEAQDTSKIQHAIIALLASGSENLFMVGDEDQSIYGFRAAYPEALLTFEKNYPDAKVLLMEVQVFIWMEVQISLLRKTFRTTMFMVLP